VPDQFCAEARHIRYPVGLDVGDVVPGHRFIVRGICLFHHQLTLHYAWVPGLTVDYADGSIFPNFSYIADVPPTSQDHMGSYAPSEGGPYTEGKIQYTQPPTAARYVFFDFFSPEFDYDVHFDRRGRPDREYLENRVSRLTVELATGHAVIEESPR
jgi:hypothetical protein